MRIAGKIVACLALAATSLPANAKSDFVLQPVQIGAETARFNRGVATLDLRLEHGAVQVQPRELDHGSIAFNIAVYNGGAVPANIDAGNFQVTSQNQQFKIFTRQELVKKAENRAFWSQMGLAALGGVAAGLAASQRDVYESSYVSPYGVAHSYFSAPSAVGQLQSDAILAGTGVGIYKIQQRLDETREALRDKVVQMTTVDPGGSYGGMIVVEKIKTTGLPQPIRLTIRWNGEDYQFAFQLARDGAPAPIFTNLTRPETPPAPQPAPASLAPPAPAPQRPFAPEPVVAMNDPPKPAPAVRATTKSASAAPVTIDRSYEINVGRR